MIATGKGTAWSVENIRNRTVRASVAKANTDRETPLPYLTPHGLRRTAASIWATLDWPMTDTMAAMGHASPHLTLTVYAQAMRQGEKERTALRALANGRGPTTVPGPSPREKLRTPQLRS